VYVDYRIDEHIEEVRASLAGIGWGGVKEQVFVNALKVRLGLDVYRATPVDVKRAVEARSAGASGYHAVMEELREGMKAAALLLSWCGIPGPGVLPYQYQLIGLSEALLRTVGADRLKLGGWIDDQMCRRVDSWLWATTYATYFTGMTGSRIRDAIDHLQHVVAGSREPLPEDLDRRVEAIDSFRGSATRTLALVLLMANAHPDPEIQKQVLARLAESGTKIVDRIFSGIGDTILGNRVVTVPDELKALRDALERHPSMVDQDLAQRHFIPANALEALAAGPGDPARFLELRGQHLRELEAVVIRGLGLEPESLGP
jgi:hypothetical protein